MWDVITHGQIQITDSSQYESYPAWSPDGQNIVFARTEDDWTTSLRMTPVLAPGEDRLLQEDLYDVNYLFWAASGGIACIDENTLYMFSIEGYFSFQGIELAAGENLFHVIGTDASGNVSPPSEAFCIIYDTSLLPDPAVTSDDIFIYPPTPLDVDEVNITTVIRNQGQVEVKDVAVDMYLRDATGDIELLKSDTITHMAPDSEEVLPLSWDTSGKAGTNTVIVVVDPENQINEASETNNVASRAFFVATETGISMTTTLDADQYSSGQDVNVNITFRNSGTEKDVVVEVWIEDDNGYAVTLLETIRTHIPYASDKNYGLVWNTATTYAGSYRVHTLLKDGSDIITEHLVPFILLPDIDVTSTLVTDRPAYRLAQNVIASCKIKNSGGNYMIPALDVNITIMDKQDNALWSEQTKLHNLLPGVTATLSAIWNTGLHSPGDLSGDG